MDQTVAHWLALKQGLSAEKAFEAVVESYLSLRHRNNPARGCALPALAADIGRSGPEVRRTFAGRLEKMIEIIARLIPKRSSSDARQAAASAIATMVGSIVLARAAGDKRLSDALLEAGRHALRTQVASGGAERPNVRNPDPRGENRDRTRENRSCRRHHDIDVGPRRQEECA